jgi:hypothetical protein
VIGRRRHGAAVKNLHEPSRRCRYLCSDRAVGGTNECGMAVAEAPGCLAAIGWRGESVRLS